MNTSQVVTDAYPRYNVLMLAPTMFFADYGSHVRILEEAVSLRAIGHKITILAYPNGRDVADLNVLRSWGVPFNSHIIVGSSRAKYYLDAMLALKSLSTMFKVKPDLIHAHLHEGALIGTVLSRLWRVPLIFDFQGSMTSEMLDHGFLHTENLMYKPLLWLEKCIDRWADVIITSSYNATRLLKTSFGRANGGVHTVSDCVNPDVFHPAVLTSQERIERRKRYGIPLDAPVVIYLGLLADYQGIPQLIHAAKRVLDERPDTHFLIFGFPDIVRYQTLAREVGVEHRIQFPGPVPYDQVPATLALGDVAVAPKLSATEGAGKILNYMAMALPVVAFDTPVSCEYLGDCGTYAEPGSVDELARDMLTLLNDPQSARERGQLLRQRILEQYTWRQGADKITEVYRRVCPHPRRML